MKDIGLWLYMVVVFIVLMFAACVSILFMIGDTSSLVRFISMVVFVSAVYLLVQRDTYLPFLGTTVVPPSFFHDIVVPSGANVEATVEVPNVASGTKVVYWGAMPFSDSDKIMPTPQMAYKQYANSGVAVVVDGKAKLKFFCPVKYQVPWGKTLDRHIHYRVVDGFSGFLGPVKTVFVKC